MFKHYFELIDNVAIYPIISLIIFLVFFASLMVWVFSLKRSFIKEMKDMPLDLDKETSIE
jgi:hypothetical protein